MKNRDKNKIHIDAHYPQEYTHIGFLFSGDVNTG
jgi:hypothetical protein